MSERYDEEQQLSKYEQLARFDVDRQKREGKIVPSDEAGRLMGDVSERTIRNWRNTSEYKSIFARLLMEEFDLSRFEKYKILDEMDWRDAFGGGDSAVSARARLDKRRPVEMDMPGIEDDLDNLDRAQIAKLLAENTLRGLNTLLYDSQLEDDFQRVFAVEALKSIVSSGVLPDYGGI